MEVFNLDSSHIVVCETKNTRNGFKHVATLCRDGYNIATAKANYFNRTWESFTYETVLKKIVEDNFAGNKKQKYLTLISERGI